jgi:hypothetical protein
MSIETSPQKFILKPQRGGTVSAIADMSPLRGSELVLGAATYYRHGAPLELVSAKRMEETAIYYKYSAPPELVSGMCMAEVAT